MSEIEERQQAPIMVLISSCGLDYTHPPSAAGLVACRSMSELMPPVIAVVGTCLSVTKVPVQLSFWGHFGAANYILTKI